MPSRSTGSAGRTSRNILEFEDTFPDAHVVKLEQNYRSTQTILDAANAVIRNNRGQKPKSLWTDLGQGDPIKVRELDDEHAEARFVTGEIQRLVDEGTSRAEIAVFYRTNSQSRVLEDTLVRAEIAYQVIGGHQVLRAGRDQGRDRLPDGAGQPPGRGRVHADRQLPPARDRRDLDLAAAGATPTRPARRCGSWPPRPRTCPAWARRRSRRCGASWARWRSCASALEAGAAISVLLKEMLAGDRLPGGAGGRAHDRGPGPDREPRGAGQRRRRVRRRRRRARARWRSSCSRSRWSPTPTRAPTTRAW